MKKILLILPLFLLTILSCKAQDKEPSDFIPKGYAEFKKYSGDLNKDGLEDCVLIIKKTDSTNVVMNRFDKKLTEIGVELLCYLKMQTVMNLLIKI